jgi:hypothetical protein
MALTLHFLLAMVMSLLPCLVAVHGLCLWEQEQHAGECLAEPLPHATAIRWIFSQGRVLAIPCLRPLRVCYSSQ